MKLKRMIASCLPVLFVFLLGVFGCSDDPPSTPETDTTPPPPPTNLTVTQQSLGFALDWDIPLIDGEPVPDLRGYRVYRDPTFSTAAKPSAEDEKKVRAPTQDEFIFVLESDYLDRSVAEGTSYRYSATAIDDSLNESESVESGYNIFDTASPLVTITSPQTGFVTNVATIIVSGAVVDSQDIASANIYLNDVVAAQANVTAGAFSGQVTLTYGSNTLRAEATDPNNNVGVSNEVSVTLDSSTVVVQITSPQDGTLTSQERVEIVGVVSDPAITQGTLIVNGSETSIVIVSGGFSGIFTDLIEGVNAIEVRATNQAGTTGSSGSVRVTRDTEQPLIYLIEPVDGATVQESPIFVSGTITEANPPDSVTLSVGGEIRKLALVQGQFQAYADLREGSNSLIITATDLAGNTGSASATVTLNSEGPIVRITTPQDGDLLNDADVSIGGTVSDPTIESGNLFVDGFPILMSIVSGIFIEDVTLQGDGEHSFWAEVVDDYDRTGVSDTITVTLDTTPPVIAITSPADSSKGNVTPISVAGTVDDDEVNEVTVVVNGFGIDATVLSGSFSTTATLNEGWNAIYARGADVSQNTGYSDTISVLLDTQAEIQSVDHDAVGEVLEMGDHVIFWLDAGETGGQASVDIEGAHTGITLYDDGTHGDTAGGDGQYMVDYTIQAGDEASAADVIGHFTDHVGNVALDKVADNTITINVPPGAVTLFEPGMTEVSSSVVNLKWTASSAADFQDYRLYRDTSPGVNTLSDLVTTITDAGQDTVRYSDQEPSLSSGSTYYYRVYVRDQLGASIPSNEVSATLDNWPSEQTLLIPADMPAYMDKIDNGAGIYVILSQMIAGQGAIKIINFVTDVVVKTLETEGITVGVATNQYTEVLVAAFDAGKIVRVHGQLLDFDEAAVEVGEGPWDVASGWGPGDSLYAFTGIGDNENSVDDSIAVVNLHTGVLDYKFPSGGVHYSHFGASPDGHTIYAASPSGTVATINPAWWSIDQVYGGFRQIFDLNVTQDYIFLPHEGDDRVSVLNRGTMGVERELIVPGGPVHCMLLTGRPYLYVSCMSANTVRVYSTQTWQEVDRISIATPLAQICNDQGDKVYVGRLAGNGGVVVLEY